MECERSKKVPERAKTSFGALLLLACSVVCVLGGELPPGGGPVAIQTLAPLIDRIKPSVVTINATVQILEAYPSAGPGLGFPDGPLPVVRDVYGAGIVADSDRGFLVTSHHLVRGAETISVRLSDGRSFTAHITVTDEEADLAILNIPATGLVAATIDGTSAAQAGDFVLAMGDPLGLEHSTSFGMISGLHRSWPGVSGHDLIQADLLLEHGSSGGPLFNLRGEIIGINIGRANQTISGRGFGFAAPASAVIEVLLKAQRAKKRTM